MVGSSVFPARDNCSTVMGVMDARSSASDVRSVAVRTAMLLLGDKASSDVIRAGAQRAVVSAVFEVEGAAEKPLVGILEANGLDESDDGTLILRREIAAGGKGRVFVHN